jgi:lysozyme
MMNISNDGINFLKRLEALRFEAYLDAVKVPTIGYGSTRYLNASPVNMGDKITEMQAEDMLRHDLAHRVMNLNAWLKTELTQCQFDALCSFVYNVGLANFKSSTMLKKINAGDFDGAAMEFCRWVYGTVNGKKEILPGLITRRAKELALFLSGKYL